MGRISVGSKKAFNGWKLITDDKCIPISERVAKELIRQGIPLQG